MKMSRINLRHKIQSTQNRGKATKISKKLIIATATSKMFILLQIIIILKK